MATQTVKFTIECEVELECDVILERSDIFGAPDYFVFDNEDFARKYIDISGTRVLLKDIPKELRNDILEVAIENIDERAWE